MPYTLLAARPLSALPSKHASRDVVRSLPAEMANRKFEATAKQEIPGRSEDDCLLSATVTRVHV